MKNKRKIIIFGGGNLSGEILDSVNKNDYLMAADRAALWLLNKGKIPDLAIGDFDSVNRKELSFIKRKIRKTVIYSPDKNYSDMELAVRYAVNLNPEEIMIFGASGSRLDHTLASLFFLEYPASRKIKTKIIDTHNEIFIIDKKAILEKSVKFKYFSLLSVTQSSLVSISGSLYDLSRVKIKRASSLTVSNEIIKKEAVISVHRGRVLLVRSRD